uniref:Phage protein n=1 Tax=Klebsiella phage PMBT12 TaxID=3137283 RepID=A0AAU8BVY4_9VIRU
MKIYHIIIKISVDLVVRLGHTAITPATELT